MLWLVTALTAAVVIVGLLATVLFKREGYEELGAVSSRWISDHRAASR